MSHVCQLKPQLINFLPNPSPKSPPRAGEGTYTPIFTRDFLPSPSWRGAGGEVENGDLNPLMPKLTSMRHVSSLRH